MSKWIILSIVASCLLTGCVENNQTEYPKASPCVLIRDQMNKVRPSEVSSRMTPTEEAKLARDYEHYHCYDAEESQ